MRSVQAMGVLGEPGSGKYRGYCAILSDHHRKYPTRQDIIIVVATGNLRAHVADDIVLPVNRGYLVKTW
jgi:hypothetical protein